MSKRINSKSDSSAKKENNNNSQHIIRQRIKALAKLQIESLKFDQQLARETFVLEVKYDKKRQSINEKRRKIISGEYEPKANECDYNMNNDEEFSEDLNQMLSTFASNPLNPIKGIPNFWLLVLKSTSSISLYIEEYDEPVLKYLNDIKLISSESPPKRKFVFCFDSNEFFTNNELTKEYEYSFDNNPKHIRENKCIDMKRTGCKIDWKKGKDLTKGGKNDSDIGVDSFFDFFTVNTENRDENTREIRQQTDDEDWDIAEALVYIIPKAVRYLIESPDEDDYEESDI